MSEQKKSIDNVIRIFLIPSMIISFIFMFLSGLERAGFLYFSIAIFSIAIFSFKGYQDGVYGAKFKLVAFAGLGIGVAFLVLSAISPAFSLLTPTISLSVDTSFRVFVIIALAPIIEECWRSAMFGLLNRWYKMGFWGNNITQAIVFSAIHITAYGVFLGAFDSLISLYGGILAISGSLLSAFVFGLISGWMMEKFDNIVPSQIAHAVINFWMVQSALIVVG